MVKIEEKRLLCQQCIEIYDSAYSIIVETEVSKKRINLCKDHLFQFVDELNAAMLAEFGKEGENDD